VDDRMAGHGLIGFGLASSVAHKYLSQKRCTG
jgi:hypothetical protein